MKDSGSRLLVSAKVDGGQVRRNLGGLRVGKSRLSKVLVARRRSSRVGKLNIFDEGCRVPVCTAPKAVTKVGRSSDLKGVPRKLLRPVGTSRPFRLNRLSMRPFTVSRSTGRPSKCHVRRSKGSMTITASLKGCSSCAIRGLGGLSTVLLRTGRSVRVLRIKKCPCCLGREVLNSHNRLSGRLSKRLLYSVLRSGLGRVVLNRLDGRGGCTELTCRAIGLRIALTSGRCGKRSLGVFITDQRSISSVVGMWG